MPTRRSMRSPFFRWRTEKQLTSSEVSKRLGISQPLWGKWESGETFPATKRTRELLFSHLGRKLVAAQILWYFGFAREDCEPFFRQSEALTDAPYEDVAPPAKGGG